MTNSDQKDILQTMTRKQSNIISFLYIQHERFFVSRHNVRELKIARILLKHLRGLEDDEIKFVLTAIKFNLLNFLGLEILVAYYRQRKLNEFLNG
jgi:hypothetical protein